MTGSWARCPGDLQCTQDQPRMATLVVKWQATCGLVKGVTMCLGSRTMLSGRDRETLVVSLVEVRQGCILRA